MRLVVLSLLLASCATVHKYEDIGQACVGEPEPFGFDTGAAVLSIADGDAAPITVVLSSCSSGSIDWLDQVCEVSVEGDRIAVTTSGKTKTPTSQTDDCRWVTQDCGTVDLTAGGWTLVYGSGEAPFTVPYDGPAICAEAG